jgi:hypothetical protein
MITWGLGRELLEKYQLKIEMMAINDYSIQVKLK